MRGALKRALEIGIGLFVGGWAAAGYLQAFREGVTAECDRKIAGLRAEFRESIAETVQRERDRDALIYRRRTDLR